MDSITLKKDKTKITKMNSKIQKVQQNIDLLEEIKNNNSILDTNKIKNLVNNTSKLLNHLEKQTVKKLRKKPRKKHKEIGKPAKVANTNVLSNNTTTLTSKITNLKATKKEHHRLHMYNESKRILKTMDLMEALHFKRSQDAASTKNFSAKLDNLRFEWLHILEQNTLQTTTFGPSVEEQWNEAFFGIADKNSISKKQKLRDFLRIRRTWDTYLTSANSKHGSSIPIGWVLPREEADERWLPYRQK